ncbi:MAG: hypothetical protein ACJ0QC_05490 [Flavobacteriales bacterium]|nr:hypothetical protein [Flavobacteriales bacterium]
MKLPNLPSFFNKQSISGFNFTPRFYNTNQDKRKKIKFKRNHDSFNVKGRNKRITFIIIILSLLAYYFLK